MKSLSFILVGLFVAQLAVAGVLYYNAMSQRAVRPQGTLLVMDASAVDEIAIEGDGEAVTLEKSNDAWVIGSTKLPADTAQVEKAIQSFADMKLGWAVANSEASHQQLAVADSNFERRVKISGGGSDVGNIFIGTSPGFKRSHVRKDGTDQVYSVAINTFDLPSEANDWLDKNLLQLDDVSSVVFKGKELAREEELWVYDGDADKTDQEKAAALVAALESIRVTDVVLEVDDDLEFEAVALSVGEAEYEFGFASKDSDYLVTRQDIDFVFKLAKSSYDKVMTAELLIAEPEPKTEQSTESAIGAEVTPTAKPTANAGSEPTATESAD